MDADSGERLWKAKLSRTADIWDEIKQTLPLRLFGQAMFVNACPAIADGAVACNDQSDCGGKGSIRFGKFGNTGSGMVGFDWETGKERWRVPECRCGSAITI